MAFFEFNIAMSGLFAAQRGLQVTSNNITNATTTGYSRQQLSQTASTPLSGIGVGMTGTGVSTNGITRVRDSYIDSKLWTQSAKLGEYNIKVTQNSLIEGVFGEPSDSGFTAVFNDLFNAISNLSKEPGSGEAKVALKEEIVSFTKYYNNISSSLAQYQQDLNYELKATVEEVNTLAARIQNLNKQIFESEMFGDDANSFRDERDLCIDRLSQIVNVEATEYEENINGQTVKKFKVRIAGQTLVDHTQMNTLSLEVRGQTEKNIDSMVKELSDLYNQKGDATLTAEQVAAIDKEISAINEKLKKLSDDIKIGANGSVTYGKTELLKVNGDYTTEIQSAGTGKQNAEDIDDLYDIVWSSGMSFNMTDDNLSGELKGIIDMRDGCGSGADVTYNGIPYYVQRLDTYVRQFAKTMNEQYSMDENGYIEIDTLTVGGSNVSFIEKDKDGNIIACYDEDKNKLNLSTDELKEVSEEYTTKYKLFTYKTGNTKGEPTSGDDLKGGDYSKLTAANFSISEEIYSDISNMRTTYNEEDTSDTNFMLKLLDQKSNKKMFKEGDPKDYMIAIFSELGINAQEAKMYQSTQKSVTSTITNQRLSNSQVDTTEEFTNLIKYQQAYQAAAKIMNTIDGIYETTIFKLGNF
nr:flagellar hook-associated protein FlgK [uncultured Cellulosilyticum sp.]